MKPDQVSSTQVVALLYHGILPILCRNPRIPSQSVALYYCHVSKDQDSLCGKAEVRVDEGGEPGGSEYTHCGHPQIRELSHLCTPVCLRLTKCRSIGAEEETGGTQNKIVSVNGSIITGKINTLKSHFAEVASQSVVGYYGSSVYTVRH